MNLIERPPLVHRWLIPGGVWRRVDRSAPERKVAYLTFDDGPIPNLTPWVLDTLDEFGVKATFFMVGENVERNPWLIREVSRRGHAIGNHTMSHDQGIKCSCKRYMDSVRRASALIPSRLFRPPHGLLRPSQLAAIKREFTVVMHDVVSMDYDSRQWPWEIIRRVKKLVRPGSIIVFHDSQKAERNLRATLRNVIASLIDEGYELLPIPDNGM